MAKRTKQSAGLLMYRRAEQFYEVFLVHSGGPYWAKKERGAWTLPKGENEEGEEPLQAVQREFMEETGFSAEGPFLELGSMRQKSGKIVVPSYPPAPRGMLHNSLGLRRSDPLRPRNEEIFSTHQELKFPVKGFEQRIVC